MVLLWERAGLPQGVINLIQGDHTVGKMLTDHKSVRGVLFTGGIKAGLKIHKSLAGQPNKILALELGGNNPLVVWKTKKITRAVDIILSSAFLSSGQRCTCARRLILQNSKNGCFVTRNRITKSSKPLKNNRFTLCSMWNSMPSFLRILWNCFETSASIPS